MTSRLRARVARLIYGKNARNFPWLSARNFRHGLPSQIHNPREVSAKKQSRSWASGWRKERYFDFCGVRLVYACTVTYTRTCFRIRNAQTLLTPHSSLVLCVCGWSTIGAKGALGISCSPELKFRSQCRSYTWRYSPYSEPSQQVEEAEVTGES